ncbi:MAG: carboxymuconolactone decarboxylase family protein [Acidimicrobiales bacterium]|nr:carboxymuconolactone decarboxylase family protein [Acidimicrobiales bacterium]
MANIEPLDRSELAEFEEGFQVIEAVMGFVPRSLLTMGRNPELLRAFSQLSFTVLGPGAIDGGLKQLVAHVASTAAGCQYCQAHTASSAARGGVDAEKVAAVWHFEADDRFDDAERAALRLARDAAGMPNATSPSHFEALAEHFTDDEVVELVAVISLFGWLNRWNDTMATELEDEANDFAHQHLSQRGWTPGKHVR